VTRRRLDAELVRRGLAASRSEAQAAIAAGSVLVGGAPAAKPAALVGPDDALVVQGPARRFVSRGGDKLDAAIVRFGIEVAGRRCLDAGASTGGFTDRLLQGGAAGVVAIDVGYGQLDWRLRRDPRITVMERTNVRHLVAGSVDPPPGLVVADLSFISLRLVIDALAGVAAPGAEFVFLVKPQFEAGPEAVGRGGVVRDPLTWRSVVDGVLAAARAAGIGPAGLMASPVRGPAGNVEFLLYGRAGATSDVDVEAAMREAEAMR
jgi:23S rRNA (cytidine1920-2'-O)/16S rRNA (cytidine1409-2'-O)-methyltransferase